MSKTAKLDCESEVKQIRFCSPEGRIRADSRLVFSHVSAPAHTLPESNSPARSRIENPVFTLHPLPLTRFFAS
jgi:hypothetical protein